METLVLYVYPFLFALSLGVIIYQINKLNNKVDHNQKMILQTLLILDGAGIIEIEISGNKIKIGKGKKNENENNDV